MYACICACVRIRITHMRTCMGVPLVKQGFSHYSNCSCNSYCSYNNYYSCNRLGPARLCKCGICAWAKVRNNEYSCIMVVVVVVVVVGGGGGGEVVVVAIIVAPLTNEIGTPDPN